MDNRLLSILSKWEKHFTALCHPDGALLAAGVDGIEAIRQVSTRAMSPILLLAWIGNASDSFSVEIRSWAESRIFPSGALPF